LSPVEELKGSKSSTLILQFFPQPNPTNCTLLLDAFGPWFGWALQNKVEMGHSMNLDNK
jgi:hypothetical protein